MFDNGMQVDSGLGYLGLFYIYFKRMFVLKGIDLLVIS